MVAVGCGYLPVRTPFTLSDDSHSALTDIDRRFKILSWNVQKRNSSNDWQAAFSEIVAQKQPDIVLLQEARLDRSFGDFISLSRNYGWVFSPNVFQKRYDAYAGVLTASRSKAVSMSPLLSNGLEVYKEIKKPALLTYYSVIDSEMKLLVINIHGLNFNSNLDGFKEQIRRIAEIVIRHQGPVIMAGDFNTWSQARLDHLDRVADEMKLTRIEFGSEENNIASWQGHPLDHMFISQKYLTPVAGTAEVLDDLKVSDHQPLLVELEVELEVELQIEQ
jgi:endonuclease/exonuclease/phosphatase (EEP) superfamily protein YafD